MGVQLDPSFVSIVPLGGRYVRHFWSLLTDLHIPYATLVDLDLGRAHGGAKTIREIVSKLVESGTDLSTNWYVVMDEIDLDELEDLEDDALLDPYEENKWLQALKEEGVFFSYPLDLDFSMLTAFRETYQRPNPGGRGPRADAVAIQEKKAITLKTGGDPDIYGDAYDEEFTWYPYLFLNRSKPETHLDALSRVSDEDMAKNLPPELKALIDYVKVALGLNG